MLIKRATQILILHIFLQTELIWKFVSGRLKLDIHGANQGGLNKTGLPDDLASRENFVLDKLFTSAKKARYVS